MSEVQQAKIQFIIVHLNEILMLAKINKQTLGPNHYALPIPRIPQRKSMHKHAKKLFQLKATTNLNDK